MAREEFMFVRTTMSWRLWALGFTRYRTAKGKEITALAFGPLRFNFYRVGSQWDRKGTR